MSSPQSWEITPDPFGDTRVPLHDSLFGVWDADRLELIGEEYELSKQEYQEEGVEYKKGEEGEGTKEHEVGKEPNEEITVMMPYYPSGQTRVRRTARMRTPQLKRYSFPLSPPPGKRTKTTSGKTSTGLKSTRERGESSHAPQGMDEIEIDRVITTDTVVEEMKKEIHSLKERVQLVERENHKNRAHLQQAYSYMGMAYNNVGACLFETDQRRAQLEMATGDLARQVMVTDNRSITTEARVGACERSSYGIRSQVDNLTYLFGSRFGFP